MGLDLYFLRKQDYIKSKFTDNEDLGELVYGRKTWALVDYFELGQKKEYDYLVEINRERFKQFEEDVEPYIDELKSLVKYTDKNEDTMPQYVYDTLESRVEDILDYFLDCPYSLGAIWEARVVIKLYNMLETIYKVYDNGDSIVMLESY